MFLKWWRYFVQEFTACEAANGIVSFKLKSIKISHFDGKKIVLNFFVKGKKYFFCFFQVTCILSLAVLHICFFWVVSQFIPVCVKFSSSDSLKETYKELEKMIAQAQKLAG